MKIGIIGLGMVGGTIEQYYKTQNELMYHNGLTGELYPGKRYEIEAYDPYKGHHEFVSKDCNIIFICVPTPYSGNEGYDLTAIKIALEKLKDHKESIICLKCTVLPGTTRKLIEEFGLDIVFNPEFLTESTAQWDFENPENQIVGIQHFSDTKKAQKLLSVLPKISTTNFHIVSLEEAEAVKIMTNTFFATKVIFANQFYDYLSKIPHADYEVVRKIFETNQMVGKNHWDVWHNFEAKGHRGYAGKCLIKETKSTLSVASKYLSVLAEVDKINDQLLSKKN